MSNAESLINLSELYKSRRGVIRVEIEGILKNVRDITFDDVFQEAAIVLMEAIKRGKFDDDDANPAGYLYKTCVQIARRHADKSRQKPHLIIVGEKNENSKNCVILQGQSSEDSLKAPDEKANEEEKAYAFLDSVMNQLSETERLIFKYYYWEKMSMEQIASTIGLRNSDTVKSTKSRAMKKFRDIAQEMLKDDQATEDAIRRTMERSSLIEELEECRQEDAGELARSSCKDGNQKWTDRDIVNGIKNNSPEAWRALYALFS
jgi:RNA polymerase sigma factor (sigma-70 family)